VQLFACLNRLAGTFSCQVSMRFSNRRLRFVGSGEMMGIFPTNEGDEHVAKLEKRLLRQGCWRRRGWLDARTPIGPMNMARERQPIDELNPDDRGLQRQGRGWWRPIRSPADLLARPDAQWQQGPRGRSSSQTWTTKPPIMSRASIFDIFLQALQGRPGPEEQWPHPVDREQGRVSTRSATKNLKENKPRPIRPGRRGRKVLRPRRSTPDYALYGTAMDLPNRATNFYQIEFKVVNLQNRTIAFRPAVSGEGWRGNESTAIRPLAFCCWEA